MVGKGERGDVTLLVLFAFLWSLYCISSHRQTYRCKCKAYKSIARPSHSNTVRTTVRVGFRDCHRGSTFKVDVIKRAPANLLCSHWPGSPSKLGAHTA